MAETSEGTMKKAVGEAQAMLSQYPPSVTCLLQAQKVDLPSLQSPTPRVDKNGMPLEGIIVFDAQRDGKAVKVEVIDWSQGLPRGSNRSVGVHVAVWDPTVPVQASRYGYQPRIETAILGTPASGDEGGQYLESKLIEPKGKTSYYITEAVRNLIDMGDGQIKYSKSTPDGNGMNIPESGVPESLRIIHENGKCFRG